MSRADAISIIAGGWSFVGEGWDKLKLPGCVIGVNEAVRYQTVDIAVSMDRLWVEHRWNMLQRLQVRTYLRKAAAQNIPMLTKPIWLTLFDNDHQTAHMTHVDGWLNGSNSGGCALNLAYQMRPHRLYLFGFDMCNGPHDEPHWHPPYEWKGGGGTTPSKMMSWVRQFAIVKEQFVDAGITVYNCSARSKLDMFTRLVPAELEESA